MGCTTILVGKHASDDGSTLMARNEDSGAGSFAPKKMIVVRPEEQVRHYVSVISKVEIDLPDDPLRYTAVPNALADEGIWGEAGINSCHVAMTETETITSNARVLGSDPLVKTGIGEEDLLTITLPYIRSAREGVLRLGKLLDTYGTYEMNGIGFQDVDEIWWMETIGGHHWIAKRVPDNAYAVVPNQQGIDRLDLRDAFGEKKDNLCSDDLLSFIRAHHL
ncbi:MAG: C69 family dipeptidase, partial [Clostridia bacterium]|nr:C69 family dipeptidase [Clostridia bacterium]